MSQSSDKTRRQLRKQWKQCSLPVSFSDYKTNLGWTPKIQKGWLPRPGVKAPHEQGKKVEQR